MILYNKYEDYILTIETILDRKKLLNTKYSNLIKTENEEFNLFQIEEITHITNYNIHIVDGFVINNIYDVDDVNKHHPNFVNLYFEDKNDAFNYNFMKDKQYKLFDNGYCGFYREYYLPTTTNCILNLTKKLKYSYFHNNGQKCD